MGDLLILNADTIHKTNDSQIDRVSVRCDLKPKNFLNRWNHELASLLQNLESDLALKSSDAI